MLVRVMDGVLRRGDRIRLMHTGRACDIEELGIFAPKPTPRTGLGVGEVGFVIANIKRIDDCRIGDTVTADRHRADAPLPGFREAKPMVFAGLYPTDADSYEGLRDAMEKLRLNDAAFSFEPESSAALGFGFRCGFLGLLHMEIVQERLEREFDLSLITTAPGVSYRVTTTRGEVVEVHNPSRMPAPQHVETVEEPVIHAIMMTPPEYVGHILKLCDDRRGVQRKMQYLSQSRVLLEYEMPLAEVVLDFYDKLKSGSRGYASLDYQLSGHRVSKMVKLDLLVNGDAVDALSLICHRERAVAKGRALAAKMKELIPRQMFEVVVQAAVAGKVLCRETVRPLGKNVTAKCYGGDITRKRKLLEKQKEGKRRMKRIGRVDIPQDAFLAVLRVDS
jgi:GTP-binding protein LepA